MSQAHAQRIGVRPRVFVDTEGTFTHGRYGKGPKDVFWPDSPDGRKSPPGRKTALLKIFYGSDGWTIRMQGDELWTHVPASSNSCMKLWLDGDSGEIVGAEIDDDGKSRVLRPGSGTIKDPGDGRFVEHQISNNPCCWVPIGGNPPQWYCLPY